PRPLARPSPDEVPDGIGKGSVVSVSLGRRTARGVVAEIGVEAPNGIVPVEAGRRLGEVPPVLVALALWLADYYGSTPARALELVAPELPKRRVERPSPAE